MNKFIGIYRWLMNMTGREEFGSYQFLSQGAKLCFKIDTTEQERRGGRQVIVEDDVCTAVRN